MSMISDSVLTSPVRYGYNNLHALHVVLQMSPMVMPGGKENVNGHRCDPVCDAKPTVSRVVNKRERELRYAGVHSFQLSLSNKQMKLACYFLL